MVDKVITPKKAAKMMRKAVKNNEYDPEATHARMDDALCEILESLGYHEAVEIFKKQHKWYA